MPGLVGLHSKMSRGWAELQLNRMVEAMQHETSYLAGIWVDELMGLYLGWVGRKHFCPDGLPFTNNRGDLTLFFLGEEFSDSAPGANTKEAFRSRNLSTATYLVNLAEKDPSFPASLNGRFHGLLINRTNGTVTLFNDRYGMRRLYYHQSKEAFYFAAEAKAILAVRPELKKIETRALAEYVTCGCVLENRTLFEGISVLPGASKWTLKNGSVERKGCYFTPQEWEEQEILKPEEYYNQLRDVFVAKLPRYFESNEQIGMSLTGGVDTRMILAWHRPAPGMLPCYTFGGTYRDCQDVVVARKVALVCEQPHQVIKAGNEFLSQFPRYAERTVYLTDGCADVRRASDLYLNERARQIAPVRMTGNYGSEVLRGVRAFKPSSPLRGLFQEDLCPLFRRAEETYNALVSQHPVSFAVFKQAPWHHYGLLALEETQVSLRSPYLDNDLVKTVFQAPHSASKKYDVCLRLIADGNRDLRKIPTDRGVGRDGPIGFWLRKREEFLVKAEYAYDYGMPHWVARVDHLFSPLHLERLFLGRHKFNHYRIWYRDALAEYVRAILLDPRTLSRAYTERRLVEAVVHRHLQGRWNYTNEIHCLLTLELLQRLFIDTN